MSERLDVGTYFSGREEMRRRELVWGIVREPPAPLFGHQAVVLAAAVLLRLHVKEHQLGKVCISPIDVVLDEQKALIVQPDVVFISHGRAGILRDRIWGAPDLVVEVLSRGTFRYDSTTKLDWYRTYGVRECWLIDANTRGVRVVNLETADDRPPRSFTGDEAVGSAVLPAFRTAAREFFE